MKRFIPLLLLFVLISCFCCPVYAQKTEVPVLTVTSDPWWDDFSIDDVEIIEAEEILPDSTDEPTATAVPTSTATERPTSTAVPTSTATEEPTATAVPTSTATERPTATAVPTSTATEKPAASAEPEVFVKESQESLSGQSYRIRLFSEPQAIKLPKATTSYWFMIPEGTEIEAASLVLVLETSATLLDDYSTATVEINGIAIASIDLMTLADVADPVWEIEIPVDRLKTDGTLNQLSIVTAQRSILGDCADIDNPANWLVISDESSLLLTIIHAGSCRLDNLYPFLFNRVELGNTLNTDFFLAGNDPNAEFASALEIASAIGANYPYKLIEKMTLGESGSESTFVINADSSTDPELPSLEDGEGYLSVSQDDGIRIEVAGGQAAGLKKAVGLLSNEKLLSQFSSDEILIQSSPSNRQTVLGVRESGKYTLADFNYSDLNLAGAFHQQANLTIYQPDGVIGGPTSYFEVHFRHSDALISDTSLLTVQFDGVPAASTQLSRTNMENGKLRVKIPAEVLAKGRFDIGIDVYNYLGKIDCSKDWFDVAWTVISADSVIYFEPTENTVVPSLERFPSLRGDSILLYLPENSSETVREAMLMLAAKNGQNTQLIQEYQVTHDMRSVETADTNILIAGVRGELDLPAAIRDELYVVPAGDGYSIMKGVNTIPEALKDKIIIQVIRSPYNFRKTICLVIWPDEASEQELLKLVSDGDSLGSLNGNLAIIGGGRTVSLDAGREAEEAIPLSPDVLINRTVRTTGISKIGLGIILILVIVVIILIIRESRIKNRFDKAKRLMTETNNMEDVSEEAGSEKDEEEDDENDFDRD